MCGGEKVVPQDVLGLGFASCTFSDGAAAAFAENHENVLELYYSLKITDNVTLTPDIQCLSNPGGVKGPGDATVIAVRGQIEF